MGTISDLKRALGGAAGSSYGQQQQAIQGSSALQMAAETRARIAQEEHRLRDTAVEKLMDPQRILNMECTSEQFCDTNEWDTVSFATESKPKSIREELQEETDKWLDGL